MSRSIRLTVPSVAALLLSVSLLPAGGLAQDINTGDAGGAYHASFCPRLEAELRPARFAHTCKTSQGTLENLKRVAADPRQIGFGQLDILALEGVLTGTPPPVALLRRDDARECLFAVTRNKDVASYGDLATNARQACASSCRPPTAAAPAPSATSGASTPMASVVPQLSLTRRPPTMRSVRHSPPMIPSRCSCSSPIPTTPTSASWRSSAAISCR